VLYTLVAKVISTLSGFLVQAQKAPKKLLHANYLICGNIAEPNAGKK